MPQVGRDLVIKGQSAAPRYFGDVCPFHRWAVHYWPRGPQYLTARAYATKTCALLFWGTPLVSGDTKDSHGWAIFGPPAGHEIEVARRALPRGDRRRGGSMRGVRPSVMLEITRDQMLGAFALRRRGRVDTMGVPCCGVEQSGSSSGS